MKRQIAGLTTCFILLGIYAFIRAYKPTEYKGKAFVYKQILITKKLNVSLTKDNVKQYIYKNEFKFPSIVIKQCWVESAHLKSLKTKRDNNIMGLRIAKSRKTTAIAERDSFAVYGNWKECLDDYLLLQQTSFMGKTETQYYSWLKKYYAQDTTYIATVKNTLE